MLVALHELYQKKRLIYWYTYKRTKANDICLPLTKRGHKSILYIEYTNMDRAILYSE